MPRSRGAAAEPACRASTSRPLCLRVGRLRLRARGRHPGVPGAAPSSLSHSTIRPHEEGRASARTPRPGSDAGLQQVHPAWQGPTPQAALGPQLRPAARARRAHLLSAHSGVAGERYRADTRLGGGVHDATYPRFADEKQLYLLSLWRGNWSNPPAPQQPEVSTPARRGPLGPRRPRAKGPRAWPWAAGFGFKV